MKKQIKNKSFGRESSEILEKILELEGEVSNEIFEAKSEAEAKIEDSKKKLPALKRSILEKARETREKNLQMILAELQRESDATLQTAQNQAETMAEKGKAYIQHAVDDVFDFLVKGSAEER